MDFEFDPEKNFSNLDKHGIDLGEAQKLWQHSHIIIPAKNVTGENRYAILGKIRGKVYMAIFTIRDETIRVISCHRADKKWEKIYENSIKKKEK